MVAHKCHPFPQSSSHYTDTTNHTTLLFKKKGGVDVVSVCCELLWRKVGICEPPQYRDTSHIHMSIAKYLSTYVTVSNSFYFYHNHLCCVR